MHSRNDLSKAQSRYRALFVKAKVVMLVIDPANDHIVDANPAACAYYGYSLAALKMMKIPDINTMSVEQSHTEIVLSSASEKTHFDFQHRLAGGELRDVEVYSSPIEVADRKLLLSIVIDVTERHQAEKALKESEERFRLAMEATSDGIWDWDIETDTGYFSPAYYRMLGYQPNEFPMAGRTWASFIHPDDYQRAISINQACIENRSQSFEVEYRMKAKDGSWRWILGRGKALSRDKQGHALRMIGTHVDITERKQMEEQVRQMAFQDSLTKLPNRRLLSDRLSQTMAANKRSGRYGALIFLDLDNFKPLNDTYGHEVGDLLLIEVADRLKSSVREMDTVSRFGGDEFVVIISELEGDKTESTAEAGLIAEKIRAALAEPYVLRFQHTGKAETTVVHQCTSSIGVMLFINHGTNSDDIIRWGDMTMYEAKEAGGNTIRFYESNA